MSSDHPPNLSDFSMLDLFRLEVETQVAILNEGLLALEENPGGNTRTQIEPLMRAAHSIKGAARIVQLDAAVQIAHVLEDCLVAAQDGKINLETQQIDALLAGVDWLVQIANVREAELENWCLQQQETIQQLVRTIGGILTPTTPAKVAIAPPQPPPTHSPSYQPLDAGISSMLALFRTEVKNFCTILNQGVRSLPETISDRTQFSPLIHAAYSIKGAARIVDLDGVAKIATALETSLASFGGSQTPPPTELIQQWLQAITWLDRISEIPETELETWVIAQTPILDEIVSAIAQPPTEPTPVISPSIVTTTPTTIQNPSEPSAIATVPPPTLTNSSPRNLTPHETRSSDRVVRVSADNLNRLMGLAGESLVAANWLQPFADSLLQIKRRQTEMTSLLERLHEFLSPQDSQGRMSKELETAQQKANQCLQLLSDRLNELENFARRSANLSDRLYREAIASQMRPFADGVQHFPRLVRDLARQLGKQVKFELLGKSTAVDRDILEKLEAPLTHMLRNALDHGIESPEERRAVGKPAEATVRLEAMHRAGMLSISVVDDGRGVDLNHLRDRIVAKKLVTPAIGAQLTEVELMEFLFLPGFSTAQSVTEISGRGVGLDVVQSMVQQVGGVLRAVSHPGQGMSFHLQLPLTLSVVRSLLVEIAGEPYAFPLARIDRIIIVPTADIQVLENRQYFTFENQSIGLVKAEQVLELAADAAPATPERFQGAVNLHKDKLCAIAISDRLSRYALVVDRCLGERDLVVRPLDPRLGKVTDISAAALMEDGTPVLIIDIEDLVRSIDKLLGEGQLTRVTNLPLNRESAETLSLSQSRKRILVVDDSITVREVERKLLENYGYEVEVAVNGMDGWNAVRTGKFDLVITDVDMPRMNGIELVTQIKNHPTLKALPVMIVSYKDREEDRL